jgi:ATP-dependent DNA helicase RecQ
LYDFLLKNKNYEIIIKAILRVYQGAFEYPVNVDEQKLAKFMNLDKRILVQRFEELHKFNIIYYTPAKNEPQLTYLLPRENADDLVLDFKRLKFLKERYRENINAIIRYAEEETCRQVQLLNYFGEQVKKCGTCDVCRSIRVEGMTSEEGMRLKNKVKRMLLKESLSNQEIVESFHTKSKAKIVSLLAYLIDEGFIQNDNDKLIWADEKK